MIDPDAYAALLTDWCLRSEPGQQVLILTTTLAQLPAAALCRVLLDRGAWPLLRLSPPELLRDFYHHARDRQLDSFAPLELVEVEAADAVLRIEAPGDTRALAAIDPTLLARVARARAPIQRARMQGGRVVSIWPTPALAREAGMTEHDYEQLLSRALFLDRPDPVAAWSDLRERQQRLIGRLSGGHELRIEAPGTDLRLDVGGRPWINSDGRHNMPSGEVFTAPHERSATGTIRFNVASVARGAEVAGVELSFAEGRVVHATAERGEQQLLAALATDDGARYLGELGIGTNGGIDRATGSTLLDEKLAGSVHLALGRSYPQSGGTNVSALHWDLVCDLRAGGALKLDGEAILNDGVLAP